MGVKYAAGSRPFCSKIIVFTNFNVLIEFKSSLTKLTNKMAEKWAIFRKDAILAISEINICEIKEVMLVFVNTFILVAFKLTVLLSDNLSIGNSITNCNNLDKS